MEKDLRELHLRNLVAAALSDGAFDPKEEAFIEEVRNRLKGRKGDVKRALTEEVTELDLAGFPRLSQRLACLEDVAEMLLLSDANDEVDFDAIEWNEEPFESVRETMLDEAASRVSARSPLCVSCGAELAEGAAFCSACGASQEVDEVAATPTELVVADEGVTVCFQESTSSKYPRALELAQDADEYTECLVGGKTWNCASFRRDNVEAAMEVANALKGLRNRRIFIDGEEADWGAAFSFGWCAEQRENAYRPDRYCFFGMDEDAVQPFGCSQIEMGLDYWSEWLTFGEFEDKSTFAFDKERMRHKLEQGLAKVALCPYLQPDFARAVLDRFPKKARVGDDTIWEYKRNYQPTPDALELEDDWGDTMYVVGVRPKSFEPLLAVMRDAGEAVGVQVPI